MNKNLFFYEKSVEKHVNFLYPALESEPEVKILIFLDAPKWYNIGIN